MPTPFSLPRLRLLAAAGGLMCAGLAGAASGWKVPPIDGDLAGELAVLTEADASPLRWSVTVRTGGARERTARFKAEGTGARLSAEVQVDPTGDGTWQLREAEVDLGRWFVAAAPYLSGALAGISSQGSLVASGSGTLREGVVGGRATVSLRQGRIDDPAHTLQLEGISVSLEIDDIALRRTKPSQVLTWQSGRYDTIPLGAGRVVFGLSGDVLRVEDITMALLGGEVTIGAFTFAFAKPEVTVTAQVSRLDVAQLKEFLPAILLDARGRLDGRLTVMRTAAGIEIGAGRLSLREGETAELRLAPTPGLLSASLPPAVLRHYPGLGKIELGEVPIRADLLEITFTPEGDAAGRTASVHIVGGPVDPKLRAPIDLNVNVRGSLQSLIKFGTNSRLRMDGAK